MKEIFIIDSTLRDGSHAIRHQFKPNHISEYAAGAEKAHIPLLIVGHGNGLGASSLLLGKDSLTDMELITLAYKELKETKLGAFLIPGFATFRDDLNPVLPYLDTIIVASHCSEADTTKQYIEYIRNQNKNVIGVLMMQHMLNAQELLEQAKKMQDYGAQGIILMDSAGASLPNDVKEKTTVLVNSLKIKVGFHSHNNLSMAVANALVAVEAGATIIDATSRGFGAGAGNCSLEVIVAILHKLNYITHTDLYQLLDNSENIVAKFTPQMPIINSTTIISGLAGVFSGFCPLAEKAAKRFNVDARDILMELGKRKIIAGQEDFITQVAIELSDKKAKDQACTF